MKSSRAVVLIALLIAAALVSWWFLSHRNASRIGSTIAVFYTKMDGTSEAAWQVSMRPQAPGESAVEHLHNAVLYAAVQAVVGPPPGTQAIRFPVGTRVRSVDVTGSTATVDLSSDVGKQAGGTFGESGEFKALVYTLTALPGIRAVKVTIDGRTLDTLPGGHLELDQPLHRSDW